MDSTTAGVGKIFAAGFVCCRERSTAVNLPLLPSQLADFQCQSGTGCRDANALPLPLSPPFLGAKPEEELIDVAS